MANGLHSFVARESQNGHVNSFGVSSRKPLPLSLFAEVDEEEQIQENEDEGIVESKDEEDEFGEFESVPSDIVKTDPVPAKISGGFSEDGFADFEAASLGIVHEDLLGIQTVGALDADGFGNVEAVPSQMVHENGVHAESKASDFLDTNGFGDFGDVTPQSAKDEAPTFTTPASEWMLAMHGIHHSQKSDGFSFQRSRLDKPVSSASAANFSKESIEDDPDNWGDFVESTVPTTSNSLDSSAKIFIDLFDASAVPAQLDAGHQSDMIDLLSFSDEQPTGSMGNNLGLETPGKDFLWDSEPSKLDFSGASLLDLQQDVPAMLDEKHDQQLSENTAAVPAKAEAALTGDQWGFDMPLSRSGIGNEFSRSVSLPSVDSTKPVFHERSHSSGNVTSSLIAIEEWSLEESVGRAESLSAKAEPNNGSITLNIFVNTDPVKDSASDLIDLLDLDWEPSGTAEVAEALKKPGNVNEAVDYRKTLELPEIQLWYLKAWILLARTCASELESGLHIWQEATTSDCCTRLVSSEQGQNYFRALLQIYRVYLILSTTLQLYASWLEGAAEEAVELNLCMNQSREAWEVLENAMNLLPPTTGPSLVERLKSFKASLCLLSDSDTLADAPGLPLLSHCALSLLPLKSVPDVPSIVWGEDAYFLPVANLWANRVSRHSPKQGGNFLSV